MVTATQTKIKTTKVFKEILQAWVEGKKGILLEGGTYSSKCLGKGTRIIMSDMTLKAVEDVKVNDCLMGIDGKPRKVLRLYQGQDNLFKVRQAKGTDYIVSSNHILSLKECWREVRKSVTIARRTATQPRKQKREYIGHENTEQVINIPLPEYISKGKKWRRRNKGWQAAGVELPAKTILVEPYFLGLWLGDGTRSNTNITNADAEIINYLKWFAVRSDLNYRKIKCDKYGHALSRKNIRVSNSLRDRLRYYGIFDKKRIPHDYLNNSSQVRMEVLAGLIDSDGYVSKSCTHIITQKSKELADDIALLTRSLGFHTIVRKELGVLKREDGSIYENWYYSISFAGEKSGDIPLLLDRKRLRNKSLARRLHSSIEIEPAGFGDYYGFELDGDHLFLLEDFTVTHNTYSALQALITIAMEAIDNIDVDVVSESIPHLKGGCLKDFFNILGEVKENNPSFNQTDHIYRRNNWKGVFSFLSADNEKALGMRRDILFINEADTISWEVARELISRTNVFVILDWNPRSEFWAHQYYKNDPKWAYSHSTYLDALNVIPAGKREDIEDLGRKDPNYRNIYELGLMGKIEGLVHPLFKQVDELPDGFFFYGLDFGFGPFNPIELVGGDPTVLVKNVIIGDNLYSKQMFYEHTPMTNDDIAREMTLLKVETNRPIYPDPNEPKSAEELRRKGFLIGETEKGAGSVKFGIKRVNQFNQFWTSDSLLCIKDQRNYSYIKRKDPNSGQTYYSDDTTHKWSHGMDSLIAGTLIKTKRGDIPIETVTETDFVLTREGWKNVLFSGQTAIKEVQTIKFSNGKSLTGTADHLIWVIRKGFTPLNTLRYGDIMEVCREKQLSTTGRNTTAIQKHLTGLIGCISGQGQRMNDISTDKCGLTFMAKSRQAMRYITRIMILLITRLRTLSVNLMDGITSIMQPLILSGDASGLELISGNIRQRQMLGIVHLKDKSGIRNWEGYHGKGESHTHGYANNVGWNTRLDKAILKQSDSVQINASQNIAGTSGLITKQGTAKRVVNHSASTDIQKSSIAPVFVLHVSEPHKEKQPVFDITTENIPEFYANGILVHNSRRYGVASTRISTGGSNRSVSFITG